MKYVISILLLINALFAAESIHISSDNRLVQANNYELSINSEGTLLNIAVSGLTSEDEVEVELMNMQGGLVKIIPVQGNQAQLDISGLSYGFYFIKAKFSNGLVISKAITIP